MRASSFARAAGISALCGIAFGLAAPPSPVSPLAWVALAPLLYGVTARAWSVRQAFGLGTIGGLGVGLLGFPWIVVVVGQMGGVPLPLAAIAMLIYTTWMAIPFGLFAIAVALAPQQAVARVAWITVAFAAAIDVWPVVFPYTPAIGLTATPEWIQIAELGGTRAIEMPVVWVGLCLVALVRARERRHRMIAVLIAIGLPLGSYILGRARMAQIDAETRTAERVRIGLIQPNTPVVFGDPDTAVDRLRSASRRAQDMGAQLVVWPEAGVYPFAMLRPLRGDTADPRRRILASHDLPTLLGIVTYDRPDGFPYNTLAYLHADGTIRGTYDKTRRVLFGEYLPLLDPEWLRGLVSNVAHLNAGDGPTVLAVEHAPGRTVRLGPLICLEDIIEDFAREVAAQDGGIEMFVNATIDAWYGDTSEPWEHLALAKIRTVEHRIPMIRSVSTGVSGLIDPAGRLLDHLPPKITPPGETPRFPADALVVDVPIGRSTADRPTLFARGGWLLPHACRLLSVVGLVWLWLGRRARRGTVTESASGSGS